MSRQVLTEDRLALSLDEVAALLSVHERTVRRLVERGELEVVRFGKAVRVPREALARLLDSRRAATTHVQQRRQRAIGEDNGR